MFESVYHSTFIHTGGEDLRIRWATVRPLLESMLKSVRARKTRETQAKRAETGCEEWIPSLSGPKNRGAKRDGAAGDRVLGAAAH